MEITYEMQHDQAGLFSSVILKNYLVQNYAAIPEESRVSIQNNLMTLYQQTTNPKISKVILHVVQTLLLQDYPRSHLLVLALQQQVNQQDRDNLAIKMIYKVFKALVRHYFDQKGKAYNNSKEKEELKVLLDHKSREVQSVSDQMAEQVRVQIEGIPALHQTHDMRLILQQFGEQVNISCVSYCVKLQVLQQRVNRVSIDCITSQLNMYHSLYQRGMNGLVLNTCLSAIQKSSVSLLLTVRKLIQRYLTLVRQLVEEG